MKKIEIQVTDQKIKNQGDLFGIFFEDLNYAADGGLYGELVRNRSFEFDAIDQPGFHAMTAWKPVVRGDSVLQLHIESEEPLNENNRHYAVLEILNDGEGAGICNEGFGGGIPVREKEAYRFSCYYRIRGKQCAPLRIRLENLAGTICYAETQIHPEKSAEQWKTVSAVFTSEGTDSKARLVLLSEKRMRIELDMISLFPMKTFMNRENGLRTDIAEMLAAMKPKFMRFPGGCLTHIGSLNETDRCSMYRWKNTVGPIECRPSRRNNWNYNQTFGLGFYEYFLFCEDIGAEPLPVIAAGYDPHNLRMAELDEMQEWIDEALDLIEFANGSPDSKWGSVRAQMGHEASFHMKYLGIGNEEVGDAFFERYEIIAAAVQEKYPEIQLINSAGPGSAGSEFKKGWEQARRTGAALVDEHFYQCPEWFVANADRYMDYKETPKTFLGEYASQDDTWKNALSEAVFMIGMEKAKGVGMACYAPMLCHTEYAQWKPDLIYFDNHRVFGSASYYVQKLFMNYQGESLLEVKDNMKFKIKQTPHLKGKIAFRTQKAEVEIKEILYKDLSDANAAEQGRVFPEFVISEKIPYQYCMETESDSYEMTFKFCKKNGGTAENLEGLCAFELEFAAKDEENRLCWRIDGWQRLTSLNGFLHGKNCDMGLHHFISEKNREYEAKLIVRDGCIQTYIDGVLYCQHICRDIEPEFLYYSAVYGTDDSVIIKAVNTEMEKKEIIIQLPENGKMYQKVKIIRMDGFQPEDRNSFEEPEKISPHILEEMRISMPYKYQLPENAFVILQFLQN